VGRRRVAVGAGARLPPPAFGSAQE